jgi:DNA replication initiation complex subunit (GINS family)
MDHWDAAQREAADVKVAALNQQARTVTKVVRSGGQRRMMKSAGMAIEKTEDADHLIDLQLGGADALSNLWALDRSVNRSLGAQIAARVTQMGLSPGDIVTGFTIG